MKIINEKGKLFGIINIIDLLIIIFVALVAWVMVMFFSSNSNIAQETKKCRITIEMTAQEKYLYDAIVEDKQIFDKIQNQPLGTLVDKRIEPCVEYNVVPATGEYKETDVPDRYDIELDIDVSSSEDMYVGKRMSVQTKDFTGSGYIIRVAE